MSEYIVAAARAPRGEPTNSQFDPSEGNGPDLALKRIVVWQQDAVLCISDKRLPMSQRITKGLGERCLWEQTNAVRV
jgi:hypothetical protein